MRTLIGKVVATMVALPSAATSSTQSLPRVSPPVVSTPTASPAAAPDDDSYTVIAVPPAACHRDSPCAFDVVLEARGDYHVNDKYPYRFKPQDPAADGVSYPKSIVDRGDMKIDGNKATFTIPFTGHRVGNLEVGGVLSLSVCRAANCVVDKKPITLSVRVDG